MVWNVQVLVSVALTGRVLPFLGNFSFQYFLFMDPLTTVFVIAIIIFSVIVHEVSHGYAAFMLGDRTAYYAGRLSLNPLKHLDPIGSVVVPLLAFFTTGFVFGWAKPVPFNPYNLRNQRWGELLIAAAGPLSNIVLALLFGTILRFGAPVGALSPSFIYLATIAVLANLGLAIFNLVPIPPLDGSKILFSFLPTSLWQVRQVLEQYGFVLILVFIFFLSSILLPIVGGAFELITGFPLN